MEKGGRPKNPDGPKQKSLYARCSPLGIKNLMTKIEEDNMKMAEVITMGFGTEFPEYDADDLRTATLKLRWGSVKLKDLKAFVTRCPMESNEEKTEFREAFLLILAKTFLCPTTNPFISPDRHLPLVLNVENPMKYNWSLQIFSRIKDSIRDFQRKYVKHLSSCMFILIVILFHRLECEQFNKYHGGEPCKPDIIYAEYHESPSFSLGFSQEFKSPIPSPERSPSEDDEVLDIPPIREMLPEEDPSTIQLKPLTLEQDDKIYDWVMNPSKAKAIQEETIAIYRGYQNFFLLRSEIRYIRPRSWINDKIINWRCKEYNYSSLTRFMEDFYCVEVGIMNTTLTDNNLDAYQKEGKYVGMHQKLGEDGKNFDRNKAANRKWGKLIEDMLKIVIPTFDHNGFGFLSQYAQVPKQLNNDDCGIYVIKFFEEWKEDSKLTAYTNEELLKIRRRLVLEISLSNYNTIRVSLLQKAFAVSKRRNNPNRGKKKEV
ncbi:hypothetical protein PIB30_064945 [Stylosanthes scabra]|uniref:Ubiquitin-like protease family profile domain-containing protein n=1 Tax=Stylosanthes scabra TaxID=79078 RepID=A0ABU6ZKM7_9FABA|nr:hypothetical protein [Stylosanthes scabra]